MRIRVHGIPSVVRRADVHDDALPRHCVQRLHVSEQPQHHLHRLVPPLRFKSAVVHGTLQHVVSPPDLLLLAPAVQLAAEPRV